MADDQHEAYSADVLCNLKATHEKWVSSTLAKQQPVPPVRVRRIKENIPTLIRLTSGQAVLAIVDGAHASEFEHDESKSQPEVELVSGFLQEAQ